MRRVSWCVCDAQGQSNTNIRGLERRSATERRGRRRVQLAGGRRPHRYASSIGSSAAAAARVAHPHLGAPRVRPTSRRCRPSGVPPVFGFGVGVGVSSSRRALTAQVPQPRRCPGLASALPARGASRASQSLGARASTRHLALLHESLDEGRHKHMVEVAEEGQGKQGTEVSVGPMTS